MIDLENEEILTFQDACQRLPRKRAGRRMHPGTLYRWASTGLRGVRLETLQVGGSQCTSVQALQRFFERLSRISARATSGAQDDGSLEERKGNGTAT